MHITEHSSACWSVALPDNDVDGVRILHEAPVHRGASTLVLRDVRDGLQRFGEAGCRRLDHGQRVGM